MLSSMIDFIGQRLPQATDATHPHGPLPLRYSSAHIDLLAADLVRKISRLLPDKSLEQQVFSVSQQLARAASANLPAAWDFDDDWCPTWPFPHPPFPFDLSELTDLNKPEPQPWQSIAAAEQVQLAYLLTQVAGLTSEAALSKSLVRLGASIAAGAARTLADEFERCGTRPRPKFPKKAGELTPQPA